MTTEPISEKKYAVAGIGELLWDVFPNQKRIGGAPANFAYHVHQLGADSWPVSCLGADALGRELRSQLSGSACDLRYVAESDLYATGTVDVRLSDGKPSYDIHMDAAWDYLEFTPQLQALASGLDAVCFGSLSQRSQVSRQSVHSFLSAMPAKSVKIFDVNLRQSFFSKEVLRRSLEQANVLKLSDEELPVLLDMFDLEGGIREQLLQLLELFDLRLVAYTRGSRGSLLQGVNELHDFPGTEVDSVDTVGAGDSFTAALCMGLLRDWKLSGINFFANEVAGYVCTQQGATPEIPDTIKNFGSLHCCF
ncbi:carbohydrate kinase [Coraliomargarita sp. SDUM461003]|uniref:Carbohydrate kinase n=1 Tax=Thalassobacterium maritimum TaxID=3041265 RepID=A0ABU1AWB3_9BACT|nr:carbohydrate kinase [Coraliomargarita sp. SDUM461003]MDQ8208437.1 carbohydrate kinase [Coraliomargarita sp. SDUM461003]